MPCRVANMARRPPNQTPAIGLHDVAVRHDPSVGMNDGSATELADRPRANDGGRPGAAAHRRRRADTHRDHDNGRLGAEHGRLELRFRRGGQRAWGAPAAKRQVVAPTTRARPIVLMVLSLAPLAWMRSLTPGVRGQGSA